MEESENRSGIVLAELLLSRIRDAQVDDIYIDEDDEGVPYLGLVFSDGEKEYHLTVDGSGTVELAEGVLEGEDLEMVTSFALDEVQPPFSEDSSSGLE